MLALINLINPWIWRDLFHSSFVLYFETKRFRRGSIFTLYLTMRRSTVSRRLCFWIFSAAKGLLFPIGVVPERERVPLQWNSPDLLLAWHLSLTSNSVKCLLSFFLSAVKKQVIENNCRRSYGKQEETFTRKSTPKRTIIAYSNVIKMTFCCIKYPGWQIVWTPMSDIGWL